MVRVVALIALAGCGRVGFEVATTTDSTADVLFGHDEDGDGIPDVADVCPHIMTASQGDVDGDGVGDECDPNPTQNREQLRLYTLAAGDQPFGLYGDGVWTQLVDAVRLDGLEGGDGNLYGSMQLDIAVGDVRVAFGADILEIRPAPASQQHQLAMTIVAQLAAPHDFVELNERVGSFSFAEIARFDGTTYSQLDTSALANGMHTGAVFMQATQRVGQGVRLDTGWPGEMYNAESLDGLYSGASLIDIHLNNLYVDFRYVCVITSM